MEWRKDQNLIYNLHTKGLQHKCQMLFVVFWRSTFWPTLYYCAVIRHLRPTFVLVTLLSRLTKILLRCVVVSFLFFFRQEFKCTKQRFCLLSVQNSRRYNNVCYKGCGAMLSLNSKPGTGRKQTNLQVHHLHFYKHCTDFVLFHL